MSVFKRTDSEESQEFWRALDKNRLEISRWPRWMQQGSVREELIQQDDSDELNEIISISRGMEPSGPEDGRA